MRRSGQPSRPRAITCCFFASLKTLLIPMKATALHRNQRPRASFSLAGFQVTLIGRFWVTAEARLHSIWMASGSQHILRPEDIEENTQINQWFTGQVDARHVASCVEPFSSSVAQETDARSGAAEGCVRDSLTVAPLR